MCKDIFLNAKWDNRICVLFEEGKIYENLKEMSDKIFSLKNENRNKKKIVEKIVNYCKEEKIDIITVHHGGISCNIIYIELEKKLKEVKFVRYFHGSFDEYSFGNGENKLKNFIVKKVMQKAIDISDKIIYISKAVQKTFEDNFKIKRDKGCIIYNGISEDFFLKPIHKTQNNKIINLIFVGRIEKIKGINLIIDAFYKIENEIKNLILTIVGDGTERESLEEEVKKLNLEDKIKFVGRQENVIEWLDKADIFIYPSIWKEGFGISVVEAMARGCIPIVSNRGALPEIIKNEYNGFVFEYNCTKNLLTEVLKMVIELNKEDKERIKCNAINDSGVFKIENTINELNNVYIKLIQ